MCCDIGRALQEAEGGRRTSVAVPRDKGQRTMEDHAPQLSPSSLLLQAFDVQRAGDFGRMRMSVLE